MKAENNPYPSILVVEGTAPTSPASGDQRLFIDSADHKLKRVNSSGTVTTVEGGAGGSLSGLSDTLITSPSDGQGLLYKAADSKWENGVLPGAELGYTQVTTAQTISTVGSWQDVTGLSVTVTIGSRPVNILVEFAYVTFNTAGHTYNFGLYDVTAAAFVMIWGTTAAVANQAQHVQFYRRHNPAAGSRTYKVQAFLNNAGDTIVTPGLADRPTSIQVVQL